MLGRSRIGIRRGLPDGSCEQEAGPILWLSTSTCSTVASAFSTFVSLDVVLEALRGPLSLILRLRLVGRVCSRPVYRVSLVRRQGLGFPFLSSTVVAFSWQLHVDGPMYTSTRLCCCHCDAVSRDSSLGASTIELAKVYRTDGRIRFLHDEYTGYDYLGTY